MPLSLIDIAMEHLSEKCQATCRQALSTFDMVCDQIRSGNIEMQDICKISEKRKYVERLCKEMEKKELSCRSLLECLEQRVHEYYEIKKRQKAYQKLCSCILDKLNIKGMFKIINMYLC